MRTNQTPQIFNCETPVQSNTYEQILNAALRIMQIYGYNAFSYADISEQVGVRKASIHYHFPLKSDLGKMVVVRYRETFRKKLDQIDWETDNPSRKLEQYIKLYLDVLQNSQKVCLCGMLGAEVETLPEEIREEVKGFFAENEAWLKKVLVQVNEVQEIGLDGFDEVEAQLLLTALEGAMLMARLYGDVTRFYSIVQRLLTRLNLEVFVN